MTSVFVEVHPFHVETLYFYHAGRGEAGRDAVFGNAKLHRQELFAAIDAPKSRFTLAGFLGHVIRRRVRACHYNTINLILYPVTLETMLCNARVLASVLVTWLLRRRNEAIVHEANQFYDTGEAVDRRTRLFRMLIGWWFIRLLSVRYVLSPEVRAFLTAAGKRVELLDSTPLELFEAAALPNGGPEGCKIICWVGPVLGLRRAWERLFELSPRTFERANVRIIMVCNIRSGEGEAFRQRLRETALERFFVFLPGRPSDRELFAWVRRSEALICLYGSESYGRSKSSGARIIAYGLRKPFICSKPALGLYAYDGSCIRLCDNMDSCVEAVGQLCR